MGFNSAFKGLMCGQIDYRSVNRFRRFWKWIQFIYLLRQWTETQFLVLQSQVGIFHRPLVTWVLSKGGMLIS